ncbi:MAG: helix-hairpin-helix domain-containing protein [Nitrospiraceae bacterium]|nr:helix-hairpin-helix domain-containing protein [Nitrospiraceae bacterium]
MQKAKASRYFLVLATVLIALICFAANGVYAAQVDINSASQKDLESLKGIGPAKAKKIIDNRPYKTVDELSKAGLSAKEIEKLKPGITVGAPAPAKAETKPAPAAEKKSEPKAKAETAKPADTKKDAKAKKESAPKLAPGEKVNINTAPKEKLEALPGIGPKKAQAIIDGRPYKTPEDVMKVKGIKQGLYNKIKDNITVN